MQVIKEYIKKNDVKVIVIQRFMVNALVSKDDSSNPGPTDIFYLVKYLREECNIEPVICTTNINMFNDGYTYRHYTSIDWSSVDLCINQTNRYNLFGGVWREKVVDQLRVWTAGYEGLTYIMYTDPSIVWTNPFELIVNKGRNRERYGGLIVVDPDHVQKFANKKIEGLFIGNDFDLFKSLATKKDDPIWPTVCHKFDLVQYIIENEWEEARSKLAPIDNSLFDFSDKKIEQPKDISNMKIIKEYIKNNSIETVVIQRFFRNAQVSKDSSSNPGATDIYYLIKYLREECGIEPIISTHAIKIPSNGYTYMRHNDIEWSKVGLCINQTNLFNLFGGGWLKREVDQLKSWTNEYKGLTYVAYTDPAILWTNPFKLIVEKGRDKCHNCLDLEVDASYVQKFESQNIESLFIGRDYDLFRSMCKDGDRVIWPMINHEFDLVPYIIENEWNIQNSKLKTADLLSLTNKETKDISKIHDIVYFGSNRPARGKVLRSLFKKNTSLNKKWIGYNPNFDAETTTTTEPVPRGELKQHLDGCKVSFVIGDPAHNDNMFTYRIFENAIMDCLSVIWHEFDSKHYVFKNKELSRFYIETVEDIENLIKHLDEDSSRIPYYLELQQSEIKEYSKTWR